MMYRDFVDLTYRPKEDDVICDFLVEPLGIDMDEAAGGVAAESSIGTWTGLTTLKEYVEKLHAMVFNIRGNHARIAYPLELFEAGNMPNILSSVAGNVFGMRNLKNLRLKNIFIPSNLLSSFEGPKYGISGVRRLLRVKDRPLIGTIIKPKLGLKTPDHAMIAYEAWIGGCDFVKDDENLSNQEFNTIEKRVTNTLESRDRAEKETGERKAYLVNITAETNEMIKRAQFVADQGGKFIMVDVLTCGFSALQTLVDQGFRLVLHGHRAGHAAITKNPKHGIAMRVLAKLLRIVGVDQLHVGAVLGKMSETKEEVLGNCEALQEKMSGFKKVLPVASGGLHPRLVPSLMEIFGKDFVIQAGGGIHGHRNGTISGAKAMRQALDATVKKILLEDYAKTHTELKVALETWKY